MNSCLENEKMYISLGSPQQQRSINLNKPLVKQRKEHGPCLKEPLNIGTICTRTDMTCCSGKSIPHSRSNASWRSWVSNSAKFQHAPDGSDLLPEMQTMLLLWSYTSGEQPPPQCVTPQVPETLFPTTIQCCRSMSAKIFTASRDMRYSGSCKWWPVGPSIVWWLNILPVFCAPYVPWLTACIFVWTGAFRPVWGSDWLFSAVMFLYSSAIDMGF